MRTTININSELLKRLKSTSEMFDVSTNYLIHILVFKIISNNVFDVTTFNGIKYQDADPDKNWIKHHVTLKPQMYEKDLDMRKCFKYSFSFVVSFAIIHFLDEIIEMLQNPEKYDQIMDNYPSSYILIPKNYDGIHGFILLWGIPEEKYLEKLL